MTLDSMITQRIRYLKKAISRLEKELAQAPVGKLRGSRHGKSWQYYYRERPEIEHGTYLRQTRKQDMKLAERLAQKDYDRRMLQQYQREENLLIKLYTHRTKQTADDIFYSIPEAKRRLVIPLEQPSDIEVQKWLETQYEKKSTFDSGASYRSGRGEIMRSKSEVIIANRLEVNHVPYLYEKPLYLEGLGQIHPDFTIWNRNRRCELYWEHFGLLDDQNYRDRALQRMLAYSQNGIYIGDRLLITGETNNVRLNIDYIDAIIKNFID